jgi:hypothetical protein
MNDILGFFLAIIVCIVILYAGGTYFKIIKPPQFLSFLASTAEQESRVGLSYKPSSNVAPNTIVSKMNMMFDDMKPFLCKNAKLVSEQAEKAEESGETCSQMKKTLAKKMNVKDGMFTVPASMKKSIADFNNTVVDSICGSNNKPDMAKAAIIGSDIKGMFC